MPKYDYKCTICSHEYYEIRDEEHPQWFTDCPVNNCAGTLNEVVE